MSPRVDRVDDRIRLTLERFEVELLEMLAGAIRRLLDEPDPGDEAFARLFPVCAPDEGEVDAEVRELIFEDLLESRLEALDEVNELLARGDDRRGKRTVALDPDETALLLGVLNDIRLTLGVRVGIEHLDRDEIGPEHEATPTLAVMDHLAWMQEELLRALDPPAVADD